MARSSQMADIDQYIADSNATQPALPPVDTSAPSDSVMAPELVDNSGTKIQPQPAPIEDEEEERASIREMRKAQQEADRQRAEESEAARQTRKAIESGQDAIASTQQIIKANALKVGTAIGSVPIPGNLLLPLSILLLFFFVLVVVNGHSRLMWLWLVLTGNASLTTGGSTPTATTPILPPLNIGQIIPSLGQVTPVFTPGQNTPLVPLSTTLQPLSSLPTANGIFGGLSSLFTGVEDVL